MTGNIFKFFFLELVFMASSHLLRVLRPTYLSRKLPLHTGVFHRHFFSDAPIRSSQPSSEATLPVKPVRKRGRPPSLAKVDGVETISEATLSVKPVRKRGRPPSLATVRGVETATLLVKPVRKRGRPPSLATVHGVETTTLLVKPVKRARRASLAIVDGVETINEATLPIKPVKRRRRVSVDGETPKPKPKTRRKITLLTEEDEAAMKVSKLNLPPIDKWRQYFAIMEAQRLRFFLRNPDTAQMLAEKFVPEGSKDLIVIEAAAGMHSYLF